MRGKRHERIVLQKIISYCDDVSSILETHHVTRDIFEKESVHQLACGMCIIQIGELVSRLDDAFIKSHPEIEWMRIKGMRNIYAHDYDNVDNDTVWKALTIEIPELNKKVQEILSSYTEF